MSRLTTYILMALATLWLIVAGFICIKLGNTPIPNTVFLITAVTFILNGFLIGVRMVTAAERFEVI